MFFNYFVKCLYLTHLHYMQTQLYLTPEDFNILWWNHYLKHAFFFACLVWIPIVFGAFCDVVMNELQICLSTTTTHKLRHNHAKR